MRWQGALMKIAVLETGVPPAPLADEFGSYPDMFAGLLGPGYELETFVEGLQLISWAEQAGEHIGVASELIGKGRGRHPGLKHCDLHECALPPHWRSAKLPRWQTGLKGAMR